MDTVFLPFADPHQPPGFLSPVHTPSGKMVELAVREVVHGRAVKNSEALANPEALDLFRDSPELAS